MQDNDEYVREVHDKGLAFDLSTMNRRRMLGVVAGAGAAGVLGASFMRTPAEAAAVCVDEVPSETAGPYPADGSNGRRSARSAAWSAATSAARSAPRPAWPAASRSRSRWSCRTSTVRRSPVPRSTPGSATARAATSLYSSGVTNQNYLRGIQVANASGVVTFQSIYPGCYAGRWPHIHFEVFSSLANATSNTGQIVKTSQIALPKAVSQAVYATTGYSQSVTNLSRVSLATDMVFRDDLGRPRDGHRVGQRDQRLHGHADHRRRRLSRTPGRW